MLQTLQTVYTRNGEDRIDWFVKERRAPLDLTGLISPLASVKEEEIEQVRVYLNGCFTDKEFAEFVALYKHPERKDAASWRKDYGAELFSTVVELPLQTIPELVVWRDPEIKLVAGKNPRTLVTSAGFEYFNPHGLSFEFGCCWNQ